MQNSKTLCKNKIRETVFHKIFIFFVEIMGNSRNKILFLCSGNYYRSRLAEELFNYIANVDLLNWEADSAGLAKNITELRNPGPISKHAVEFLEKYNVPIIGKNRFPKSLDPKTISKYEIIIALDKDEHEPMVLEWFGKIPDNFEFWDVKDVGFENPETATQRILEKVKILMQRLEN
jgi:protein-tyrosine phosphatase